MLMYAPLATNLAKSQVSQVDEAASHPARRSDDVGIDLGDASGTSSHRIVTTVHHGLIVSSYAFVGKERAMVIRGQFDQVLATDMESSAIAQTCHAYKAPFLAIRGISDLCGPASEVDFVDHVDDAAERSAEVSLAVIASWIAAGTPRTHFEPVLS